LAEKLRVHLLAKELNVTSKTIIEKCKAEGIDTVKNHMSTLSAGLHATITEWFSEGEHATVMETSSRVDLDKVRVKPKRKVAVKTEDADVVETSGSTAVAEMPSVAEESAPSTTIESPSTDEPVVAAEAGDGVVDTTVAPVEVAEDSAMNDADDTETLVPAAETAAPAPASTEDAEVVEPPEEPIERKPVVPAGPQNVPAAAKLAGPRVVRYEAPEYHPAPPRRAPRPQQGGPGPAPGAAPEGDKGGRRRGRGGGRDSSPGERRERDLAERRERLAGATGRRIHRRRATQHGGGGGQRFDVGPKTNATVHEPIRMKEFCSETALNFMQLVKILRDEHGILGNVNMTLPTETAQLLALHFGIELEVIPAKTMLDELVEEYQKRDREKLTPRPPVVTLLGHVDHGKTSLMDRIRKTRVAAGEDGGITQHIGSYHLQSEHGPVTFLDTPGHEAFTAMRQRGAQVTDVVVLVVAADDGIMPQTIEAINHAKAAEVPVVVALNKWDLGDQNKLRIFGQLAEHGLTPSGEWGGDTDVLPTSATTGDGVTELVDHLADLADVLELKADATLPAYATVLEAETKVGVGSVAHILVVEGTLRVGDFVVCGNAAGKVRALLDDRGNKMKEAGPGIPAEVWGLDDVPASGDKLFAVAVLTRAKQIASETKKYRLDQSRVQSRKVMSLEHMFQQRTSDEVPELNVILKADVDGSLTALRASLGDIPSDEVRLGVRHAGVGPVNDSDILLASTSKAIIVAFRVETSVGARRLAEQHGVDVRPYRVIYDACDDIRKALSGLLTPDEKIEGRSVIDVRQIFRITKLGPVAGSYVTDGLVDRNHLAKVIRDGVVVREGCKISSLRHLKEDVKTVRAGMECGVRLEGFDDIHAGDRIETYEIIQIARSL